MVTRLQRLLLVCAMRLWQFYSLSMIKRYPMRILLKNLMLAVQSINFACTGFWSPYLVQTGAEIRVCIADVDMDSLPSQNWPPSMLVHHGS